MSRIFQWNRSNDFEVEVERSRGNERSKNWDQPRYFSEEKKRRRWRERVSALDRRCGSWSRASMHLVRCSSSRSRCLLRALLSPLPSPPLPLHDLGRSATTPRLARPRNQRHETPWKSNGERSEDRSAADPRPIKGVCTPPRRGGVPGRIMKKAFGRYDTSLRGKDFSTRISPRHRASTYSPALLRPRWALGKLNYFESFVLSRGLVLSRAGPMGGRRVDEVVAKDCFFLCIKIRV